MHKHCPFLEGKIWPASRSWPASSLENSQKRCFTVLRYMFQKYFLPGQEDLCIIFIWLNVSGSINYCMQLKLFFSGLALREGNPAVAWFQQKSLLNLPLFFSTQHYCDAVLKNAIMIQLHHNRHCFITFWTIPWVLKLRGMKGLQEGHRCGSNMLLKNRIMANSI